MDLNDFAIFRMMSGKMRWLGQRQRVLAENIANADTPKYRAHDLKSVDFQQRGVSSPFRVQLARTHDGHFKGASDSKAFADQENRTPYEVSPTGNSVIVEEQMLKVGQTAADHQLMTNLYRKHISMFRIALGRAGGR
jgi:flagellar basal-body rod protein FlgB